MLPAKLNYARFPLNKTGKGSASTVRTGREQFRRGLSKVYLWLKLLFYLTLTLQNREQMSFSFCLKLYCKSTFYVTNIKQKQTHLLSDEQTWSNQYVGCPLPSDLPADHRADDCRLPPQSFTETPRRVHSGGSGNPDQPHAGTTLTLCWHF